jgi:hypothetical protein
VPTKRTQPRQRRTASDKLGGHASDSSDRAKPGDPALSAAEESVWMSDFIDQMRNRNQIKAQAIFTEHLSVLTGLRFPSTRPSWTCAHGTWTTTTLSSR